MRHFVSKPRNDANWPNASSEIGTIVTGRRAPADSTYVGRFAPSPTGPLHFGSLVAATASYLQARANNGQWLVRVEDIDPPREQPGATDEILSALEAFGFEWDGPIHFQSASREQHNTAVQRLIADGYAYKCGCSRRDLDTVPSSGLGPIYPGTCREGTRARTTALRVRTDDHLLKFHDLVQGNQQHRLESESGDFVILRKDGLIAYQLAVVVDDHLQGITEIVRGIDLMDSTPVPHGARRGDADGASWAPWPTPVWRSPPTTASSATRRSTRSTPARTPTARTGPTASSASVAARRSTWRSRWATRRLRSVCHVQHVRHH